MTKFYRCDRCGKEIITAKSFDAAFGCSGMGFSTKRVDLCNECYQIMDAAMSEYNKNSAQMRVKLTALLMGWKGANDAEIR